MEEVAKKEDAAAPSQAVSELEALKAELAEKKEAIGELEHKILRLHADMDNLRKRSAREKEEIWQLAVGDVLTQLLPTLDNFERAIKVLPQHDWAQGIVMISKQLSDVLGRLGLEPINTEGSFNPQYHEAVMQDTASQEPENTITGEFERGYMLCGRVLRPSKVRVSTGGNNNG